MPSLSKRVLLRFFEVSLYLPELHLLLLQPLPILLNFHINLLNIGFNLNGLLILKGLHMYLSDTLQHLLQLPLKIVILYGIFEPVEQVITDLVLLLLESSQTLLHSSDSLFTLQGEVYLFDAQVKIYVEDGMFYGERIIAVTD